MPPLGPRSTRPGAPPGGALDVGTDLVLAWGDVADARTPGRKHNALRCPAAAYPGHALRHRPRRDMPLLYSHCLVASGVSRAGTAVRPRGRRPGPGAVTSLQPRPGPPAHRLDPSVPPGVAEGPGAGGGPDSPPRPATAS